MRVHRAEGGILVGGPACRTYIGGVIGRGAWVVLLRVKFYPSQVSFYSDAIPAAIDTNLVADPQVLSLWAQVEAAVYQG